jgi:hypothetical protein
VRLLKSSGLRVVMRTVPPMPPSVRSAVLPLTTSIEAISSEASSRSSAPRPAPPLLPSTEAPLISTRLRSGSTPRIDTCEPSPNSRVSCTPVMRDSASPTFLSGNWSTSSATMLSETVEAFFLRAMALWIEPRVPETTMVSMVCVAPGLGAGFAAAWLGFCSACAGAAGLCAQTAEVLIRAATASAMPWGRGRTTVRGMLFMDGISGSGMRRRACGTAG